MCGRLAAGDEKRERYTENVDSLLIHGISEVSACFFVFSAFLILPAAISPGSSSFYIKAKQFWARGFSSTGFSLWGRSERGHPLCNQNPQAAACATVVLSPRTSAYTASICNAGEIGRASVGKE